MRSGAVLGRRRGAVRGLLLRTVLRWWRGTVFPTVASPVLAAVLSSFAVLFLHDRFGFSGIEATGHTVLGVLVSLLAVFRTQQAYGP